MKHAQRFMCALWPALLSMPNAHAQSTAPPTFDRAQVRAILSHGPWPPGLSKDPSNRVSGNPSAIAFGAGLFHDKRLSRNGNLACAHCHRPGSGLTDGLPRGIGLAEGMRNTPALSNLRFQRWFGWSGANDNLWAQSMRPLLDAGEMGGNLNSVAHAVRSNPDLRRNYRSVFGQAHGSSDEEVVVNLGKALAAFQETLITPRTPFDDFRDALARNDAKAAAHYPAAAQRGLAMFIGKGRCSTCHTGAQLSNGEFHDIGIGYFIGPGRVDSGRHQGIQQLRQSRYNLLGRYSDDRSRSTAISTRHVAPEHRNFGEFKVPSLRNVARTAPYMHNGSLATLRDVVRHYSELNEERLHADGERILVPLRLSAAEIDDLVAFLESLSHASQ